MRTLATFVLLTTITSTTMALDLHTLWDHGKPAVSEQRFVAALDGATDDEKLILQTQIARTHGMRRDFTAARAILVTLESKQAGASAEVQARYFLELGRTYVSAAHPKESRTPQNVDIARRHFLRAHEIAAHARLDELAIDALHMMPLVDTDPDQQLAWNEKALAYMERSASPDARRWEGSLRHNVGYAKYLKDEYEAALVQFRLSRAAHERAGRVRNARIADWMIARTYRAQEKYAEALAIQHALERAWDAAGEPDPYVFEELEHLYRVLGDEPRAQQYGARFKAAMP
jgi:hypothetical protein